MSMSKRVSWYLDRHGVEYHLLSHPHSGTSRETARMAHIPESQLVKSILLEDERGYVVALLPTSCVIEFEELREQLHRDLEMATPNELAQIFAGCEVGAVPGVGDAFGIPTVFDESLLEVPDLYLESGDHEELVHMSVKEFGRLFAHAAHGRFSHEAA